MNKKVFKFQFLLMVFFMNFYYSQFNTIYHKSPAKVAYQVNPERKTGNVFLDLPESKPIEKESKIKEKRKRKKKENESVFSFKDSLEFYNSKKEDTILPSKKIVKKEIPIPQSDDTDFEEVDQDIAYKQFPLIYEEDHIERKTPIKQKIHMPVNNLHVTSKYGYRVHPVYGTKKLHAGVDLRANYDRVFSVMNGLVTETGYSSRNGNYVVINHKYFKTYYLHLSKILVEKNDIVKPGAVIAISGNTGTSTAPHLHFAVKENDKFINPIEFLNDLIIANNTIAENYGTKRKFTQR
ncbi:M23 family metallopeptidase [Chryseobacterium antibioticum]|uniref:M23 family metallopeptidase n=1 Tax=Chryseobacterium pyrolae TaxID=2987481 RepID=A0ABT2IMV5_9FLAO|nr:M23 family metallopeptidase [Chryseobacterium pyrolae]MCT2409999.1 M23 family metallopeptidase [Chryseobacterium pyrolae]